MLTIETESFRAMFRLWRENKDYLVQVMEMMRYEDGGVKQEAILQQFGPANPLVTVGQYRETLGRMIEAAGFKDAASFFKVISPELDQQLSNPAPQQPGQDPATQAMMAQAQAQIAIAQQKAQADIQLAREKAAAQIQLEREKAAAELMRRKQEFEAEVQLKAAKVGAGIATNVQIPG